MRTGTLAATFVGVVTLALAGCGGHAASKRPPSPVAFTVLSRYSAPWQDGLTLHVLAGAASATPHWGAVLIEYSRHRTGTYDVPPRMIATPTETGVLRISSTTPRGDVILRSVRSTYVLRWESEGPEPTLYDLGPPLDPAQLPGLAAAGVVADFTFDGGHRHAVLLVGNPVGAIPVLYGHLSGFTLAGPDTGTRMNAQIIGPDGRAYRIDIAAGKLVPEARRAIAPKREQRLVGGACTDWPAADGVSY